MHSTIMGHELGREHPGVVLPRQTESSALRVDLPTEIHGTSRKEEMEEEKRWMLTRISREPESSRKALFSVSFRVIPWAKNPIRFGNTVARMKLRLGESEVKF